MGIYQAFNIVGNRIKKALTPSAHVVLEGLARENKDFSADLELARIYVLHNMKSVSAGFDGATHSIAEMAKKRAPEHATYETLSQALMDVVQDINHHGYKMPSHLKPWAA
jgi:hypothetical protein